MDLWLALEWVGRVVFVTFFIMAGVNHLRNTKAIAGYAASKGVPAATAGAVVTGLMLLGGGIMILVRWHPIVGAALLIVFLLAAAFKIHNYWTLTDPMMRAGDQAQFWKNITLAGAALLYAVAHHRGAL
ncbi:MAG TPA: DoxX family protein [Ktedonobacterales bacterium]|nr:DoxX family protein [Ktedonobacterales bacterium]